MNDNNQNIQDIKDRSKDSVSDSELANSDCNCEEGTSNEKHENVYTKFWKKYDFAIRIFITILLLIVIWEFVDIKELTELLKGCDHFFITAAAVSYLASSLMGGWAWLKFLDVLNSPMNFWTSMRITLTGYAINNLTPGNVAGDVYRILEAKKANVERTCAFTSVVAERWASLLALLIITIISDLLAEPVMRQAYIDSSWLPSFIPEKMLRLDIFMLMVLALVAIFFTVTTITVIKAIRPNSKTSELKRQAASVSSDWNMFLSNINTINQHKSVFIKATLINTLSPLLESLTYFFAAYSIGVPLSPYLFLVFIPVFRIVSHLPISINSIGTQGVVSVLLWDPLGVEPHEAVAISLLIHAIRIGVSLLGLLFLAGYKKHSKAALDEH